MFHRNILLPFFRGFYWCSIETFQNNSFCHGSKPVVIYWKASTSKNCLWTFNLSLKDEKLRALSKHFMEINPNTSYRGPFRIYEYCYCSKWPRKILIYIYVHLYIGLCGENMKFSFPTIFSDISWRFTQI